MKKLIAMLVVGAFSAALIGCGPPDTSPTGGPTTHPPGTGPTTPPAGAEKTATGKISAASKESVTVDGKEYKVTADTKVTLDGAAAKAEDLKDKEATVTYKDTTATKIEAKK